MLPHPAPARSLATIVWLACGALAAPAHGQPPPGATVQDRPTQQPLLLGERRRFTALSQRDVPPLSAAQAARLDQARVAMGSGDIEGAQKTLRALLAEVPHHPLVLSQLGRIYDVRQAWNALETLGRSEREATKDSLLLAPELVSALEHQKKPRDAAQVAVEAWVASPEVGDWARSALSRLLDLDPKAAREPVRKAVALRPGRADLVRGAAQLEWRAGDMPSALKMLAMAPRVAGQTPIQWTFAEELLAANSPRDSAGAVEAMLALAGNEREELTYRLPAARRVWQLAKRRGTEAEGAQKISQALKNVPTEQWGTELMMPVLRALREGGRTAEARALFKTMDGKGGTVVPEVALERALNELRDGPPEKALPGLEALAQSSPEAGFRYAEALFFAGQTDSALAWYQRVSADSRGSFTGAALERTFLLEDAQPRSALPLVGRLAWEQWRGEPRHALVLADSLYRTLPKGPLWCHAALALAEMREATGDGKSALEPLLAVADGQPDDRLAPLARQRAGNVYRVWLKDDAKALAQYEECLARYPRAWNAPEVRRLVESMRRERRF